MLYAKYRINTTMQLNDVMYPLGRKKTEAKNGENLPLVTDEPIEFEKKTG